MKKFYLILGLIFIIGCSADSLDDVTQTESTSNKINSDMEVITVEAGSIDPVEISESNAKYEIIPIETLTFQGDTLTSEKLNFLIEKNFFSKTLILKE